MDIKDDLNCFVKQALNKLGITDTDNCFVTYSDRPEIADFQTNCAFYYSKILKTSPISIANQIVEKLKELMTDDIEISAINPGFINFKLSFSFLENYFNKIKLSTDLYPKKLENNKFVILDYGGANVAKQLHIGHLRSPIIGESIRRLNILLGNKVVSDTHLGDWGLQMGLTIANLMEKFDCSYYFTGKGTKPEIKVDLLNKLYPEASLRSKEDEAFKKTAQEITVKLQNKEKGYYDIWKDIREISVSDIKNEYDKLNCNFDLWYGESNAAPYVDKVFEILNSKNLIQQSQGAEIVDVSLPTDNKTIPPIIVKSSTSAELYATTEIATIIQRKENYNFDEIIYFTDSRQELHFEQVFRCCRKAEIVDKNQQLKHIGFGTIKGKDGKPFKTRSGETPKLGDIINMVVDKVKEKIKENGIEDSDNLSLKIGLAAIKFTDLSNQVSKDYIFDIDKCTSFEGKTGPYILYTAVRIKSLLIKSGILGISSEKDWNDSLLDHLNYNLTLSNNEEKDILLKIFKLVDSYKTSYNENSLNSLCLSLYDLCASFSTVYNSTKILTIEDEKIKNSKLMLSALVLKNIIIACDTLAIEIPNKM